MKGDDSDGGVEEDGRATGEKDVPNAEGRRQREHVDERAEQPGGRRLLDRNAETFQVGVDLGQRAAEQLGEVRLSGVESRHRRHVKDGAQLDDEGSEEGERGGLVAVEREDRRDEIETMWREVRRRRA